MLLLSIIHILVLILGNVRDPKIASEKRSFYSSSEEEGVKKVIEIKRKKMIKYFHVDTNISVKALCTTNFAVKIRREIHEPSRGDSHPESNAQHDR